MRRWYWRCRCCGFWPWSSPALSSECGPLPLGEGGQRRTGRRLRGGPQPALEALYQGLAVLVRPLVMPESPDLLVGESVYSLGDLIDVHLVVAGYREGGRLRGPLGALGRGVHGAGRGVGHRSDHACGGPSTRHRPLLDAPRSPFGTSPVLGEGGVEEVHVGSERLLGQRPSGLLLPVGLLGESPGGGAATLGLLPEVGSHELGELLGKTPLALPR